MMKDKNPRMQRERDTVSVMIRLYCRDSHRGKELCPDCSALREYAMLRLNKCPFQEGKTVCARCQVQCYQPEMREKIRQVMRHAGPRMITRHPVMAVRHIIDRRRDEPVKK